MIIRDHSKFRVAIHKVLEGKEIPSGRSDIAAASLSIEEAVNSFLDSDYLDAQPTYAQQRDRMGKIRIATKRLLAALPTSQSHDDTSAFLNLSGQAMLYVKNHNGLLSGPETITSLIGGVDLLAQFAENAERRLSLRKSRAAVNKGDKTFNVLIGSLAEAWINWGGKPSGTSGGNTPFVRFVYAIVKALRKECNIPSNLDAFLAKQHLGSIGDRTRRLAQNKIAKMLNKEN